MGSFYNSLMTLSKRSVVCVALLWVAAVGAARTQTAKLDGQALHATVTTLASGEYQGRRTGTSGGLKARAWLTGRFKTIGLAPLDGKYQLPFTFTRGGVDYHDAANIVGLCAGTSGARELMVISAHYDHEGVRNGRMYPGADDNASGVAVLLGLAERCVKAPFTHDALFVAFDAEELGLQGARAFLANPSVPKERIALNINLDMVGRSSRRELYVSGASHWPATRPVLERVAKRAPVKLLLGHDRPSRARGSHDDWTNQSDHGVFHAAGIPFVYFGVEDHPDYHQPTDTADKIDPTFLGDAANTILGAVIALDAALPLVK
jgi:Zn-dependent M28 family amino/carboxypeptidase